jgi:tetratricopeptide (TPR) repeat protein
LQPPIFPAPNPLEPALPQVSQPATGTKWWIAAALCAITLAAYANSFGMGFALDAPLIIFKDSRIRAASAENLSLILHQEYWWPTFMSGLYRPVTTASFLLNYAILGNGEHATGYHWVSFLLHLGNVWLVYALSLRLLKRAWPAFFAAALWAVHPICTESVTNIVGRADLLAAMAVLGGLLLYVRSSALRGLRLGLVAVALLAVATVGVFSKENAAVLLGLMLLWDVSFGIGNWWRGVWSRVPAYAAATASLALLWWVRQRVFGPLPLPEFPFVDNPLVVADFWTARLTAIKVIGLDLWLLVRPLHLSCDRSYNQIPVAGWPDAFAWLALAVVAAILFIALARRRSDRLIFFLAGFFGITLLPASNLLFQTGSIMAERFLYLPSVGFAIAVVALAHRLGRERLTAAVLTAVIALFACRTFARNYDWKDNLTLATADVQVAPYSFKLHAILADALLKQDPRHNIGTVIEEAETAWNVLRELPPALIFRQTPNNLGAYYRLKGDLVGGAGTAQGRAWYEKSLAVLLKGREADRAAEKVYDEAMRAHGKPLTVRLGFAVLYLNLGLTCAKLGRNVDALEAYRHGRSVDPFLMDLYDAIAAVYLAGGNPEGAAVTLIEKTQMGGNTSATMSALRELYGKIPGGSCAIVQEGGAAKLDTACPRLRDDLCLAWADLTQASLDARRTGQALSLKQNAIARYGCPAAPFQAVLPDGPIF